MAGKISITLDANAQGVTREVTKLERYMDGAAKRLTSSFQRGGAGKGIDLLTKQMQGLTKATDAQIQKVSTLQAALASVGKQMTGQQGPSLAALQAQQKALQRQFTQANTRLGVLQQMGGAAAQQAQTRGGGAPGGGGVVGNVVGRMGSVGGSVGELAMSALPGVRALLTVAGIAAIVGKAFEQSARKEKTLADLMPRLLGPGGAQRGVGFERRLGRMGLPLGFTTNEGLQAAENLSTGGITSLGGLQRDTKAAMQSARFFGIDLGQQATMLAEGGRMGAFKPGDGKKFATMLATEISKTGLGPRAQEVQEATLMLLNNQLRTQASANPGPVMALQTLFNKTGLPAFTGSRGAGMINQLNDSITNPKSDAAAALDQQVFLKMGARGIFDMERMKQRGLSDTRYLPTLLNVARKGTNNSDEMKFVLQEKTGISMLQWDALEKKIPGGLAGITSGRMGQVTELLKKGGVDISGGAAKTMTMTGNKLRKGEAALDEVMLRVGDSIVGKVGDLSSWFADKMLPVLDTMDASGKTTAEKVTALADHFVGNPADQYLGGALSNPSNWKAGIKGGISAIPGGSLLAGPIANALFPDPKFSGLGLKGLAAQFGLSTTSGFRPGAKTRGTGRASLHSRGSKENPGAFDFGGSPEKMGAFFDAVRQNFGDSQIRELIYSPKGMVKDGRYFAPGTFGGKTMADHYDHVHGSVKGMGETTVRVEHVIREEGVVSANSKHAVKQVVRQAVEEQKLERARSMSNKRNARM